MKILDILLYPKSLYTKITDKKATFFLGIIFIGIIDVVFTLGFLNFLSRFTQSNQKVTFLKFALPDSIAGIPAGIAVNTFSAIILTIIFGGMEVLFFSIPTYDLFKFFAKKFKIPNTGSLIKTAKVYILANVLVLPITLLAIFLIYHYNFGDSANASLLQYSIYIYLEALLPIWLSAIIVRGISVLYNIDMRYKGLVFIGIYVWNYLLGMGLNLANEFLARIFFK